MNLLEMIEERAFCAGYQQRMFDEKEDNKADLKKIRGCRSWTSCRLWIR